MLTFILYIRNVTMTEEFIPVDPSLTASELMTSGSSFMYNVSRRVLPFTEYSFRVVSCNEIGRSNQSQESEVNQTLQDSEFPHVI